MSGNTDEIKLKTGDSTTITLKGLATAGYQWSYTIDGDQDCIKVSKDFGPSERSMQKKAGASVDEVFTITAQKKGRANIRFTQQRSWEKNADPANEKRTTIVVD